MTRGQRGSLGLALCGYFIRYLLAGLSRRTSKGLAGNSAAEFPERACAAAAGRPQPAAGPAASTGLLAWLSRTRAWIGRSRPTVLRSERVVATHRVWSVCGRTSARARQGQARDLRLSGFHAHLREVPERTVSGAPQDGAQASHCQTQGGPCHLDAAAALAGPRGWPVVGRGCAGALPILWGTLELSGPGALPARGRASLAPRSRAAEPASSCLMGPHAPTC